MSGVRVAIIDSGVEATHSAFAAAKIACFSVEPKGPGLTVERSEPIDGSGHGTACAGIVHRLAPSAVPSAARAASAASMPRS